MSLYDDVETLHNELGQSDFRRDTVLATAGETAQEATDVATPPEGTTAPETETFRSEILGLFVAHAGRLETKLEPGEYPALLDWGAENPAWAVNAAGFEAAEADASLEQEMTDRHRAASGLSWTEDDEKI